MPNWWCYSAVKYINIHLSIIGKKKLFRIIKWAFNRSSLLYHRRGAIICNFLCYMIQNLHYQYILLLWSEGRNFNCILYHSWSTGIMKFIKFLCTNLFMDLSTSTKKLQSSRFLQVFILRFQKKASYISMKKSMVKLGFRFLQTNISQPILTISLSRWKTEFLF